MVYFVWRVGDHHGQQGVELWINMTQPFGWQGDKALFFLASHFVVTHADPRYLLVHVHNEHLDFWAAVLYAPQSGIALSERTTWWTQLAALLKTEIGKQDLVLMIYANAATGAADGKHVFEHDDTTTIGTSLVRELLTVQRLRLPATSRCHQGHQATWICPATDTDHRIDAQSMSQFRFLGRLRALCQGLSQSLTLAT